MSDGNYANKDLSFACTLHLALCALRGDARRVEEAYRTAKKKAPFLLLKLPLPSPSFWRENEYASISNIWFDRNTNKKKWNFNGFVCLWTRRKRLGDWSTALERDPHPAPPSVVLVRSWFFLRACLCNAGCQVIMRKRYRVHITFDNGRRKGKRQSKRWKKGGEKQNNPTSEMMWWGSEHKHRHRHRHEKNSTQAGDRQEELQMHNSHDMPQEDRDTCI